MVNDIEILARNVCRGFSQVPVRRSKATAQSQQDAGKLLRTARETDSRWEHFNSIAFLFGSRRGELLALNWSDIDLNEGTAFIAKTLTQTKNGVSITPYTKTDRSCTKALNEKMKAAFWAQKALQTADRLRLGRSYMGDPNRPVFTDELGQRMTPKAATNAFARPAKKAGVKTTRACTAPGTPQRPPRCVAGPIS